MAPLSAAPGTLGNLRLAGENTYSLFLDQAVPFGAGVKRGYKARGQMHRANTFVLVEDLGLSPALPGEFDGNRLTFL